MKSKVRQNSSGYAACVAINRHFELMQRLLAFLRLGRLYFLIGGFVFNALGTVMALYRGASFDPRIFLWGQAAITATQLATHYSNDYFDLAADRANRTPTRWSGGSRVLPENLLPARTALFAAIGLSALPLIMGIVLAINLPDSPLVLPLILLALGLSWAYSVPPFRLHSRGLGEFTTAILVPGITTLVGFYLQSHHFELLPFLAAFPLACLQFTMLMMIEFPDADGDRFVGKNTLVVRLGGQRAALLHNIVLLIAYASLPILVLAGLPIQVALAALFTMPFAGWQMWRMSRGAWACPSAWNSLSFINLFLLIGTAILELLTFALLLGLS
ncbi:MAG: prenyltransferase [Chloroflexota bacterium]